MSFTGPDETPMEYEDRRRASEADTNRQLRSLQAQLDECRKALGPFHRAYDTSFSGLSDGVEVRLDASFDIQGATGHRRGARCVTQPVALTVGDLHRAKSARAALPRNVGEGS